jgi:hypothetical protein
MDFLNFIIALHKRVGVEIPETDYAKPRHALASQATKRWFYHWTRARMPMPPRTMVGENDRFSGCTG